MDDPYTLLDDLVPNDGTPYVRKDPYGPPTGDPEEIRYWENFCGVVKNQQRFTTFLLSGEHDRYDNRKPGNFLFNLAEHFMPSLISILPPGTIIFRARIEKTDRRFRHIDLTSPLTGDSKNSRMSPAGISFFYGAMDPETCIHEVRPDVGENVVVAKFEIIQNLLILDLSTEIESRKSIFDTDYVFSYEEYFKPFLFHFAKDISRPIRKTDNEIEYVPTQVFAEFIKTVNFKDHFFYPDEKGEELDVLLNGILFKSSIKKGGKNLVLFRGSDISTGSRKAQNNHWLLFKEKKIYKISGINVSSTCLKAQPPHSQGRS
ncbi:MAG: RES domain-containing protein [Nitrospinota bacterium]